MVQLIAFFLLLSTIQTTILFAVYNQQAAMSPHNEIFKCPTCRKNVTKTQRSIPCAYCNEYFHIDCAKISVEQHSILTKNKVFKYICDHCSRVPKYCNVQEELRNGFSELSNLLERKLEAKLQENKRILDEQLESGMKLIQDKLDQVTNSSSVENSDVEQVKTDLKHCFDVVNVVDNVASGRIANLELQNSILQRRLNRADVIIRGLPNGILNLREPILKIASLCKVCISNADIQHCTYFARGKAVIVKFNSVQIRDALMISYNRSRNIMLKDVVQNVDYDNRCRIFLNDNLTDAAKKLLAVCRRLKNDAKIQRYTFMNYDIPKAKVTMMDGTLRTYCYEQCIDLCDGQADISDCSLSSPRNSSAVVGLNT